PTAVPPAIAARPAADMTGRAPATAARARPTGSHRSAPPARRSFSSGQRALLWAAGVLGALAIVIAILIVLNAQDRRDRTPPPTVTETPTSEVAPPAETPAAAPGRETVRYWVPTVLDRSPPAAVTPPAPEQTLR
ncbi:serine/threonine protein kinase, partial [Mycolicibacterium duvalii]|nr:serine/threonine protein kinase [Mycolicibacterium duvalii]